jgi:nucleoside-diphosphate-sugar epimerase
MANYLVTGGAGFIGSNIVEALIRQGESVRVLDNCATGKLSNLEEIINQIEFNQGDIRDLSVVREAVKEMDYVLHQAALPSVARSVDDAIATNEVNVTGTLNILVAAKDEKIKRVVYASSSSVYGNSPVLPKREDMPANPISPYAISKYAGEQYCKVFYSLYGLETVALRYFNVFGPRQSPKSQYAAAIPIFIRTLLESKQPIIFGDGEQSRDFTFIENVVQANLLACHAEDAAGEIFNIACGKRATINDLVGTIKNLLDSSLKPIHTQARQGDVRHSLADITKAQRTLGYKPEVDLQEGLWKTVEWFKRNKETN